MRYSPERKKVIFLKMVPPVSLIIPELAEQEDRFCRHEAAKQRYLKRWTQDPEE